MPTKNGIIEAGSPAPPPPPPAPATVKRGGHKIHQMAAPTVVVQFANGGPCIGGISVRPDLRFDVTEINTARRIADHIPGATIVTVLDVACSVRGGALEFAVGLMADWASSASVVVDGETVIGEGA